MSIAIRVETEQRRPFDECPLVIDGNDFFAIGDLSGGILKYVDEYGTTWFNGRQLNDVSAHLAILRPNYPEEAELFRAIDQLIAVAGAGPHRFLVFLGD